MLHKAPLLGLASALIASQILGAPPRATCPNPRIVSSIYPTGQFSYVQTPGVTASASGSTVTDAASGVYWALGAGDPTEGSGHDSGGFRLLSQTTGGWLRTPENYPAYIHTTWAADQRIDGCIDVASESECTAVLVTDETEAEGYFALLTSKANRGNYSLVQAENGQVTLAAIPTPIAVGVPVSAPGQLSLTVRVEQPTGGLYVQEPCSAGVVSGYRIYSQARGISSGAAESLKRAGGSWTLPMQGGETTGGDPHALGDTTAVLSACSAGESVFLSASLVFDSGFETPHLSASIGPFQCD